VLAVVGAEDWSGCVCMESLAVPDITVLSTARPSGSGVNEARRGLMERGGDSKFPTRFAGLLGPSTKGIGLSAAEIPDLPRKEGVR